MPKQKRWTIKRSLSQAELAVVKAQNYMVLVGREYEQIHSNYYDAFASIVTALEHIRVSIADLNDEI